MTQTVAAAGSTPAPKSLPVRFVGVITSPRETFQSVAASPKWFGMLATCALLIAVFTALPLTTPEGRQSAIDQQVTAMKSFGFQVNDQMQEQLEARARFLPYQSGIGILIFAPLVTLVLAGIVFAIFNAALGGEASFKQVFAVLVHAAPVSTLGVVFTGIIDYARGSTAGVANLSALVPFMPDTSFAYQLLGAVDVFRVWWVIVLAIGLGVLYRRRTGPIATAFFAVYGIIAIGIALVKTMRGGA
jgi:Yip1-like protein